MEAPETGLCGSFHTTEQGFGGRGFEIDQYFFVVHLRHLVDDAQYLRLLSGNTFIDL